MIRIRYFARLRERLGCDEESLALPEGVATLADLLEHLRARDAHWREALDGEHALMMALNQELARPEAMLQHGDEVAFFPPVTGG